MVIILLSLIVLVLLFGAAAVRGALAAGTGILFGAIALALLFIGLQKVPAVVWWSLGAFLIGGASVLFIIHLRQRTKLDAAYAETRAVLEKESAMIRDKARFAEEARQRNLAFRASAPLTPEEKRERKRAFLRR